MKSIFHKVLNANRMVDRRKDLRSKPTPSENILWQQLRNNRLGFRFKRQYSIMNYVVDFYCHKAKLAIELDGEIHNQRKDYDEYRTRYLKAYGMSEIRFTNKDIMDNLSVVINQLNSLLCLGERTKERG